MLVMIEDRVFCKQRVNALAQVVVVTLYVECTHRQDLD
jgi:hypothetical protein